MEPGFELDLRPRFANSRTSAKGPKLPTFSIVLNSKHDPTNSASLMFDMSLQEIWQFFRERTPAGSSTVFGHFTKAVTAAMRLASGNGRKLFFIFVVPNQSAQFFHWE